MYQPILNEHISTNTAEICAWCDADRSITKKYLERKWKTTHGVCKQHANEILDETIEYYEKNGFSVSDDDIVPYSNGLPIVRGTEPR